MNCWPWQTKQAPARTADSTAPILPLGGAHHSDVLSSFGHDLSLFAAWGLQAQARIFQTPEMAVGQAEGNIDWYRNRARSAEAESRLLRRALLEIACAPLPPDDADRSEWKAVLLIAVGLAERALAAK